jgi:hypothetical protein
MFDKNIERKCNSTQLAAHKSFRQLTRDFLGNNKRIIIPPNHTKCTTELLEIMMLDVLKIHFLHLQLSFFLLGIYDPLMTSKLSGFLGLYRKWSYAVKENGIWLRWGITAGSSVGKMKIPLNEATIK